MNDITRKVKIGGGDSSEAGLHKKQMNFPPGYTFGMPNRWVITNALLNQAQKLNLSKTKDQRLHWLKFLNTNI